LVVAQIGHGLFHVPPVGVLGQECADGDFQFRLTRPPVLGPEVVVKAAVYFVDASSHIPGLFANSARMNRLRQLSPPPA
jgi:hypothetical protein